MRNPRTHPNIGDMLKHENGEYREVVQLCDSDVHQEVVVFRTSNSGLEQTFDCTLRQWQEWAAYSEIV